MFSLEKSDLDTKIKNGQEDTLQNFIEIFWEQIKQQIPTWGCLLVSQQDKLPNKIEAICLSDSFGQHKLNSTLLNNLELSFSKTESEIYFDSTFRGYIYPLKKNNSSSRYLMLFCNDLLSLEQKQIIKIHNQLLQQYLDLENKYQQKENDFKLLEVLFYQMGHQLRTPLAEIGIIAETICLSSTKNFCKSQAEDIKRKITNLNLDIRYVLQSRPHRCAIQSDKHNNNKRINQNIRKIFQTSIDDFKNLIKDKEIQVKYPEEAVFLAIDHFKIKRIFDNLLSNAIYFSPQGETIDCHWQSFQEEILISICDRGCGLSSEDIQKMFLPFYSRRTNGQGLGLTIVKKIILDLKGNIWAENLPQGKTKISFVLPINK